MLRKLDVDANSRCWRFYDTVNARTATLSLTQPAGTSLVFTQRLSRLLVAVAAFFRSKRTPSEVWTLYETSTAVVADLSVQSHHLNDLASHATLESVRLDPGTSYEIAGVGDKDLRGFKFALTLTLVMNGVLREVFPENNSLANFKQQFTSRLPLKGEQLMPIAAGFMGMFLSHVWAIDDETAALQAAWDIYGTESAARRSIAFSQRLESSLKSLL